MSPTLVLLTPPYMYHPIALLNPVPSFLTDPDSNVIPHSIYHPTASLNPLPSFLTDTDSNLIALGSSFPTPPPYYLPFHISSYTANNFGFMYSRNRISQYSFPNFIYIFPKSFMKFCQELLDPKRNYENQI